MIENSYDIGLKEEFVNNLIETHGYDLVLNLSCNYENIEKNINLLKTLNINIEDLIMYKPELFIMDPKYIYEKFSLVNLNTFITLLKEDITVIDEIL